MGSGRPHFWGARQQTLGEVEPLVSLLKLCPQLCQVILQGGEALLANRVVVVAGNSPR